MTAAQFAALSTLLRLRPGPAREAARMVLVDGASQVDAATMQGIHPNSANNTIRRIRAGLALARAAAGQTPAAA